MNINYHKWMELAVENNYFSQGTDIFDIEPLPDSVRDCRNYNILVDKNQNTFSAYAGISSTEKFEPLNAFENLGKLYFQLKAGDPLFGNYTELPSPSDDRHVLYFENRTGADKLQQQQFVSAKDLVRLRSGNFEYKIPPEKTTIEIKSESGETVRQVKANGKKVKKCKVDLSSFPAGIYEIWEGGKFSERFFCSCGTAIPHDCIGIVALDMKVIRNHQDMPVNYHIDFDARSAFWQYRIVIPSSKKITVNDLFIRDMNTITFKGPATGEVIQGVDARIFTSSAPMPLRNELNENPVLVLTYSDNLSKRKKETEMKLPNPGADTVKREASSNDESFSVTSIVYV